MSKYEGEKRIRFNRNTSLNWGAEPDTQHKKGDTLRVTLRDYDDDSLIGPTVTLVNSGGAVSEGVPVECFDIEDNDADNAEEGR